MICFKYQYTKDSDHFVKLRCTVCLLHHPTPYFIIITCALQPMKSGSQTRALTKFWGTMAPFPVQRPLCTSRRADRIYITRSTCWEKWH